MCQTLLGCLKIRLLALLLLLATSMAAPVAADDAKFAFLSPPQENLLRLYWVNKQTGQVGACGYRAAKDKKQIGGTLCFASGQGAGPLGPGRYDLKASNHTTEGGVFRVNVDTGDISVCFVWNNKVVCTQPGR